MNKSEIINELATALSAAQGEIENAAKDAQNPFFKSAYADLASVRDAVRIPFAKHGLAVTQLLGNDAHGVTVETVLMHKSGQWLSGIVSVKPKQDDAQSLGSAVTYARRYSLSSVAGIASEIDDDGESAMGRDTKPVVKAKKPITEDAPVQHTAKSVKELVANVVNALSATHKTGDTWTVSGKTIADVFTPAGKQPRIKFVGDEATYILGKNETEPVVGGAMTCDVTMKETTTGAVYCELSRTAPF